MFGYLLTYTDRNTGEKVYELLGKYSANTKSFFTISSQFQERKISSFTNSSAYMFPIEAEARKYKTQIGYLVQGVNYEDPLFTVEEELVEVTHDNYKQFNWEPYYKEEEQEE